MDVVTDCYLEFCTDKDGKLEIRPGGTDFFGEAREKLLKDVYEEDVEKVRAATGKESLVGRIGMDEPLTLSFRRRRNGRPVLYTLQTIKTRESDDHHIVIGIRQE